MAGFTARLPCCWFFFSQKLIKVFLSFLLSLFWNLFTNKTVTTKGELWISQVTHFPWDTVSNKQPSQRTNKKTVIFFAWPRLVSLPVWRQIPPFSLRVGKPLNDVQQHLLRLPQARPGAKEENVFFRLEFSQGPRNDGESDNLHPGSKSSPFTYAVQWSERAIVQTQLVLGIYELWAVSVFSSCILSYRAHIYNQPHSLSCFNTDLITLLSFLSRVQRCCLKLLIFINYKAYSRLSEENR